MDYKDYLEGKSKLDFWFRAKNDLIEKLLKKHLIKPSRKLKILDIGAGTGEELSILNRFGMVYVIDIEKKALDLIPQELCKEKRIGDACNLNYPNNFFDVVVSFDVFEHIEKDEIAIKEVNKVLKKNGLLIFTVPALEFIYSAHDKALEHKRRYSKKRLFNLLKKFQRISLSYWNFFLSPFVIIERLAKKKSKVKIDNPQLNPFINNLFYNLLRIENFLILKNIKFFFGITIVGVCNK